MFSFDLLDLVLLFLSPYGGEGGGSHLYYSGYLLGSWHGVGNEKLRKKKLLPLSRRIEGQNV